LRSIDRFVDLSDLRSHLKPFYSEIGRPSIDPELMIRMLIVGYCFGIRSERRLCEEVHLNLADRWFCRLGLEGDVPDHSTFSKNRHGRFRDSDLLRELFETTVRRCIEARKLYESAGLRATGRIVEDEVEMSQAEVGAARTMIERSQDRFGLWPERLAADSAYGSAENLAWLVHDRGIELHIPVFDKSERRDSTFERTDFTYDHRRDLYTCPAGKELRQRQKTCLVLSSMRRGSCATAPASSIATPVTSDPRCCPNAPARKILKSIHEGARDMAPRYRHHRRLRYLTTRAEEGRDVVRAPHAHPEARSAAPARTKRRPRRVLPRSCRPEPSEARKTDPNAGAETGVRARASAYP
jgi:transposase